MKKIIRHLGVTLLEVLLVLAVAALIIVMSVRYYQSANISQQANSVLSQLSAIAAAVNNISQATGSFSKISNSKIIPLMPVNGLRTPWGSTINVEPKEGGSPTGYTVSIPNVPNGVCQIIDSYISVDKVHYTPGSCTDGSATEAYTYSYDTNPSTNTGI
jgi:uncharacterized protein (UPF0333 family)